MPRKCLKQHYEQELFARMNQELLQHPDFVLPVNLPLYELVCLIGTLQLGLRHPRNNGPTARVVRSMIDQIIARMEVEGFTAVAELLRQPDAV